MNTPSQIGSEIRIYKYPLELISGDQHVSISKNPNPRAFQMQGDTPTLWAEVNTLAPQVTMIVRIVATGEETPAGWVYQGTVQTRNGLVFHLYIQPWRS